MTRRILIVDDNEINRMLATAFLSRSGWETVEAEDGHQALSILGGDHGCQAVLLDISMPDINGDDVCRALRADPHTAELPIIAYTAHAMEEDRVRLLASGFDAVVIKPINLTTLLEGVAAALSRRGVA